MKRTPTAGWVAVALLATAAGCEFQAGVHEAPGRTFDEIQAAPETLLVRGRPLYARSL